MGWVTSQDDTWEECSVFKKGWAFPGTGAPPTFWPFMVVVPVGMSFRCEYITMSSLYIYYNIYNEARGLLEAGPSVILGQEGSNLSSSPAVNGCVILLMVVPCPLLSSDTHTHTHARTHTQ